MGDSDHSVERHYDQLAEAWSTIRDGPTKKRVIWPTLEELLPVVDGKRVLDVGCGDGYYAAELADRGADVLGVDVSEEMVRVARDRHGEAIDVRRADVTEGLEFVDDGGFDLILCQHVFSHLPSLEAPLAEFARVLRPDGVLVLSTHHPFHDFRVVRDREYPDLGDTLGMDLEPIVEPDVERSNYHDTERYEIHWGGNDTENPGLYYRRPLSALLQPLLDAGFSLRDLVEPAPDDAFRDEFPELAEELLSRPPRSLCLRAELPPTHDR